MFLICSFLFSACLRFSFNLALIVDWILNLLVERKISKMMFLTFILIIIMARDLETKEVACEQIGFYDSTLHGVQRPKTCRMDKVTKIVSAEFYISSIKDVNVEGLIFSENKKILFLPENIAEKFPNLLLFFAAECSLTEVYKNNFRNLSKLDHLDLALNKIERISSDTFVDLTSLQKLNLCKSLPIVFHVLIHISFR